MRMPRRPCFVLAPGAPHPERPRPRGCSPGCRRPRRGHGERPDRRRRRRCRRAGPAQTGGAGRRHASASAREAHHRRAAVDARDLWTMHVAERGHRPRDGRGRRTPLAPRRHAAGRIPRPELRAPGATCARTTTCEAAARPGAGPREVHTPRRSIRACIACSAPTSRRSSRRRSSSRTSAGKVAARRRRSRSLPSNGVKPDVAPAKEAHLRPHRPARRADAGRRARARRELGTVAFGREIGRRRVGQPDRDPRHAEERRGARRDRALPSGDAGIRRPRARGRAALHLADVADGAPPGALHHARAQGVDDARRGALRVLSVEDVRQGGAARRPRAARYARRVEAPTWGCARSTGPWWQTRRRSPAFTGA